MVTHNDSHRFRRQAGDWHLAVELPLLRGLIVHMAPVCIDALCPENNTVLDVQDVQPVDLQEMETRNVAKLPLIPHPCVTIDGCQRGAAVMFGAGTRRRILVVQLHC